MAERPLYGYEYLHVPFDDALEILARADLGLLQPATDAAVAHADDLVAKLVVDVGGFEVGREVRIEIGELERPHPRRARLPVRWTARRHEGLFPTLDGALELIELTSDPPVSQFSIASSYRPPLGAVGAASDALWGHYVAEAAVHRFLHDVAQRTIERAVAAASGSRPTGPTVADDDEGHHG